MIATSFPWLLLLIATPALAAPLVARTVDRDLARALTVAASGVAFLLALAIAVRTQLAGPGALLVDPVWLPLLGQPRPLLGVDALSAGPLVLFALLGLCAAAALPSASARPGALARLLLIESTTFGMYGSLHLGVFALLWAASAAPVLSSLTRARARLVFGLYQAGGWLCLTSAIALLAWRGAARGAAAPLFVPELGAEAVADAAGLVVPLLVAAVLLRKGILPTHSWLPMLFQESAGGAAPLFVAAHAGVYLFVRVFALHLRPALLGAIPLVAVLAIATAVYGALMALVQRDLRRTLGFLAMSQSSFVLVGFLCESQLGTVGSLMVWFSASFALTGLALATACLESRFGTVDLALPRGFAGRTPRLGALFLVLGLGACGLPGLAGFVSEDLLFHALLERYPLVGVAMIVATAANGYTVLRAYFHAFQGPAQALPAIDDVGRRERLALTVMLLALLASGLYPRPAIEHVSAAIEQGSPGAR